jgi:maleylacetate reductase
MVENAALASGFTYVGHATRVVFGIGAVAALADEIDRLSLRRVLVLSTPEQRETALDIAGAIHGRIGGVFAEARMHVPIEVATRARAYAREIGADGALAIGGGSTVGLGKAIALETGLPVVAVPTTYAGSEMTTIYGLTQDAVKTTGRDDRVLPKTVVYDPMLTVSLSPALSAVSGLNAIAHAVEGLYAVDANPIVTMLAEECIRALASALPVVVRTPDDLEARSACLYGAWLGGTVLGAVSMALHHKLCHTLGGTFDLPHAETHAVVLPHALEFNAPSAPDAMVRIARALGTADAVEGLHALARRLNIPTSLRELGMRAEDLDRAADLAVTVPYPNPRPFDRAAIRALLERAYGGSAVAA